MQLQRRIVVALVVSWAGVSYAQQPPLPVAIEFQAGDDIIRGRFFPSAAATVIATLVLIPGFGGDTTDVLGLGARLSARDVNVHSWLVADQNGDREVIAD